MVDLADLPLLDDLLSERHCRSADVNHIYIFPPADLFPRGGVLLPTIIMRSFFDRLLVAATDDFHDRRKRSIEEAAHLAPCIAVSLPHETVTDQADVQFLHIVLGSGCVQS